MKTTARHIFAKAHSAAQSVFVALTLKEIAYMLILTALFTFTSFVFYIRIEPTEVPGIFVFNYGFPLEWVKVRAHVSFWFLTEPQFVWSGLVSDIIIYFLLSFILVRVAISLKNLVSPS